MACAIESLVGCVADLLGPGGCRARVGLESEGLGVEAGSRLLES
jgi:hypothetical protein